MGSDGPHHTRGIVAALTMGQQRDNLPPEVTRFIGRRREVPAIAAAIDQYRLVTLRGAGGVGKTRLALRVARGIRDTFADGSWLVELSTVRGYELLPAAVPAEHALLISPLELPAPGWSRPPGYGVPQADAVALFVDRAQAAVPEFALSAANTLTVAELCRRLDGIPLALELAAVRLRGMPVAEILARLSDRVRVLGATRTSTDRHRTLRAAVSWSYELCTPAEQKLWAELSVFPGGFGLAAAEYVCGPGTGETLRRLADKSVIQFSPDAATEDDRYRLLDTMREFGAELLNAAGAAVA